ncbi:MAG: endonuclease [Bacteroidetes bacterium HGW-Bacteroidetes-8]|jgi:endonuclease/exonuclease/phosphatase family metal-dependent hydrolase|nr:MAG: endonuclease [Bacteroidetes bacterium HGW-Bacteroidetes-8]
MKRLILISLLLFVSLSPTLALQKTEEKSITVITYNIHHCNPPAQKGVIDTDAIADVIKESGADIALLQEVDVKMTRSLGEDQAMILSQKSGLNFYYFFKAIDFSGGDYGVAILSRFPLSEFNSYNLDNHIQSEQRVLATALAELAGGVKILLATTHLDLVKGNRVKQIAEIDSILSNSLYPLILGGDFNATPESEEMLLMSQRFIPSTQSLSPTFPNLNPDRVIDYIFIRNSTGVKRTILNFSGHKVLTGVDASDHLPVVADIEITRR